MDLNMNDRLTSYELARRIGGDSSLIVELLNMSNQMITDVPNLPCNSGEVHAVLLRDSYPEAEVHGYNMGVGSAASQTRTISEGLMKLSVYSVVDLALAQASGDPNRVYSSEATSFVMGMGVQIARKFIYGSKSASPYEIDGLATRLSKLTDPHVIDFGGAQNKSPTSLYVVAAGSKLFHMIHNKSFGSVGVKREDRGIQDWDMQQAGKKIPCHIDFFTAQFGLAIEHPDAVYRIVNIPTVDMTAANREKLIDTVLHVQKLLPPETTTVCLYGNLAVEELVEKAAREKQVVVFPEKDPWNNQVNLINGMRVRRMDVIKSDESEFLA
jgi:hypothetical protein